MKWLENIIWGRLLGLLARRVVDFAAGALLASVIPVLVSLGEWIKANDAELVALIISSVLAAVSIVWSYVQKKKDVAKIEQVYGRRK